MTAHLSVPSRLTVDESMFFAPLPSDAHGMTVDLVELSRVDLEPWAIGIFVGTALAVVGMLLMSFLVCRAPATGSTREA